MYTHTINRLFLPLLAFLTLFSAGCSCEIQLEFTPEAVTVPMEDLEAPEITLDIITYSDDCPVIREKAACTKEVGSGFPNCNREMSFPNEPVYIWVKCLDAGGLSSLEISILGGSMSKKNAEFTYSAPPPLQGKAVWTGDKAKAFNGMAFLDEITPNQNFSERMVFTVRARDFAGNETLQVLQLIFPQAH